MTDFEKYLFFLQAGLSEAIVDKHTPGTPSHRKHIWMLAVGLRAHHYLITGSDAEIDNTSTLRLIHLLHIESKCMFLSIRRERW